MMNLSYLVAAALLAACSIPDVTFPDDPSCVRLETTCGASHDDSCCTSPEVPGGTYYRSYDLAGFGDMNAPATVSNFRLDKYEVTVGRFRAFVRAGMGTQTSPPPPGAGAHAHKSGSGWDPSWNTSLAANTDTLVAKVKCHPMFQTWTDSPAANENRPMNCLTWYEAMAFCIWDRGYLPTEAEWNYAAAGGDEQRAYPWSNPAGSVVVDRMHASYLGGMDCVGDGAPGCKATDLVPVGNKPSGDGRWGQSDMAGNVGEWTLDWFANYDDQCTDCADLKAASYRLIRGGSFLKGVAFLRTGDRPGGEPTITNPEVGVRCARAP